MLRDRGNTNTRKLFIYTSSNDDDDKVGLGLQELGCDIVRVPRVRGFKKLEPSAAAAAVSGIARVLSEAARKHGLHNLQRHERGSFAAGDGVVDHGDLALRIESSLNG